MIPQPLHTLSPRVPRTLDWLMINVRRDRQQRIWQGLYLLAHTGFAVIRELCESLETDLHLIQGNQSIRRTFQDDLPRLGLSVAETPRFLGPSKLGITRLSAVGRKVCAELGWKAVESEWEQLIRGHNGLLFPRHTLGVLASAYQARRRGWQVVLLPYTGTPVEPDLLLTQGEHDPIYVEFETRARGRDAKWYKNRRWNGYVALVTYTASARRSLVQECKEIPVGGLATDLQSLVQPHPSGQLGSLWRETWGRW